MVDILSIIFLFSVAFGSCKLKFIYHVLIRSHLFGKTWFNWHGSWNARNSFFSVLWKNLHQQHTMLRKNYSMW